MKRKREKRFLRRIEKLDMLIENKSLEVERWKAIATSSTAHQEGDRVQSSGSLDKMGFAIDKYMDLEAEIKELVEERRAVISVIEQLPAAEYDILHRLYVQHKDLQDVAEEKGRSYSWATTLHGKALVSLQKILDFIEGGNNEDQNW